MGFLDSIITWLDSIGDWFYKAYVEVKSWVWPFNNLATPLYQLCVIFYQLVNRFSEFNDWVDYVAGKITAILSWDTIKGLIKSWLPGLESAISWVASWWTNVNLAITSWWSSVNLTVQGWIADAKAFLQSQINSLNTLFASLQSQVQTLLDQIPSFNEILSWFSDWWGKILAKVIAWGALTAGQIDSLIDSWFKSYAKFWEGWQDWKDKVIEFFTDPLGKILTWGENIALKHESALITVINKVMEALWG